MAVYMCTQLYLTHTTTPKVKNVNFFNLRGRSPLENELQLYPHVIHLSSKD